MAPTDNAVKITSELHNPNAWKSHLHKKNKIKNKKEDLTESIGVVPTENPPKVKFEFFSQL